MIETVFVLSSTVHPYVKMSRLTGLLCLRYQIQLPIELVQEVGRFMCRCMREKGDHHLMKDNIDSCEAQTHACICHLRDREKADHWRDQHYIPGHKYCRAVDHRCVCDTWFACLSPIHKCICDNIVYLERTMECFSGWYSPEPLRCKVPDGQHNCSCEFVCIAELARWTRECDNYTECKRDHTLPDCKATGNHACVCKFGDPTECKADYDQCTTHTNPPVSSQNIEW